MCRLPHSWGAATHCNTVCCSDLLHMCNLLHSFICASCCSSDLQREKLQHTATHCVAVSCCIHLDVLHSWGAATHCNTVCCSDLLHMCNLLHSFIGASCCSSDLQRGKLQHTATHCVAVSCCIQLDVHSWGAATHCNTVCCSVLQHSFRCAGCCIREELQHTATQCVAVSCSIHLDVQVAAFVRSCNTLQHTVLQCLVAFI